MTERTNTPVTLERPVPAGTDAFTLVAHDLTKSFRSGPEDVLAVDRISFEWPRGRMIAVRGQSGCGKSTLLNLIGALDRPTSGSITVDGVQVEQLSGRAEIAYRLRQVGFVFQSFNLIPYLTAHENVMLPMELSGRAEAERRTRAHELLKAVGLQAERHTHRPSALSGGQQQRVAIARAIANDPAVILADEPTANLDSKTGRLIVKLLHDLTREGRTVVVGTHSSAVAQVADVIVEMEDGRIVGK